MPAGGHVRATRILGALLLLAAAAGADGEPLVVDGREVMRHLRWLADDAREGRAAGSPGEEEAAAYLAERLAESGCEPAGDGGTFLQAFPIPRGFDVLPETRLEASVGGKTTTLALGEDLAPLGASAPGDVAAEGVFCGYGISAPDLGYDDYAGLDVRGKVAIVLRHAPADGDRKSPFADPTAQRRYAALQAKVDTAVAAGAAAVVVVNDPRTCWKPKDDVVAPPGDGSGGKVPVLHATCAGSRRLWKACDLSLASEQKAIDARLEPRSRPLPGVVLRVVAALEPRVLRARNVCGILRAGAAPGGPREALVLGAHYDHLGRGEVGSLAGSKGEGVVHNGADDNASGCAAVLEITRLLAARRAALRRDVLVVLFTGEEMGLLGSKHLVEHAPVPMADCVAMVNLDMVGRLERGRLQIGGTGTSPVFPALLDARNGERHLRVKHAPGGRAPSDSATFYEKGMPVLFFFTGLHADYHRPDDDAAGVDAKGLERVTALAADVCLDLASRPVRPPFTRADEGGFEVGPHLGLSLEQRADGLYVNQVEPRSPADRADLRVGDKVEEFDGTPVRRLSDFHDAHGRARPRQKVIVAVRRGTRFLEVPVVLGAD